MYVGELPAPEFFSPDTMSTKVRTTFLAWHKTRKQHPFNFQEEMLQYCRSDVDILRRCCLEFREQFLTVARVDPFCYVTIASACMATLRANHIQEGTIALIPAGGNVNNTNFSRDSIRWLDFLAENEGILIEHALNGQGEKVIGDHSVDGYCAATNTVYEYQGCFFHGCESCYHGDVVNPLNGQTMSELREKTRNTEEMLKSMGYNYVEIWEHDFEKMKKNCDILKTFLISHEVVDRLNPRDSFFGGRTNAVRLFFEGVAKYIDFTSLYPWVCKYAVYPEGHPKIITENFGDIKEYFGLVKCRVVPPRGLFHPVLPFRFDNKLMFPLCRSCVESSQQDPCEHSDDQRSFIGTWVTEEVKRAVDMNYEISRIYEVYHFEKKSSNLFRSYIDIFLKMKQEASGWPNHCHDDDTRQDYIRAYQEREGVTLHDIERNPGRRQVAKLALNSFWGRWGMNSNKVQNQFVNNVAAFNKLIVDQTKEIKDIYLPTPEVASIHWCYKTPFASNSDGTNVFLAAFTTCYARLTLYEELEKLGTKVLYFDTDSIVYESSGDNDPPLGDYLGDFTDELGGDTISTFVSGGPKNYAYKTSSGETCCKVRGFTLNFKNAQDLNFNSVEALVRDLDMDKTIALHNPAKITREPKKLKVVNKPETKKYKLVYNKRVIKKGYMTLPYGY